ncbi:hypothetical protein [Streptomyces sp. ME19-01-6]|uniref:hypothetical protein n=1 Tax=Streptomyces sp. ME19-01-6 TaxID=3028686 RepID=UPI0029B2D6A5|nr:hypothetical protein [Streptomyces sp. ME19-01-6]MDX3227487.1 hypothetical protein [Streptomyces sp. ME19-01-6]
MTQYCYRCDKPTREPIPVLRASASGPGCLRHLCPDCDRRWPRPDADLYTVLVTLQRERQAT